MRYSLRTAFAAVLSLVCVGQTFGQSALVQFNPGSLASMQAGTPSALVLGSLTIYPGAQLDLTSGGLVLDAAKFTYYAPNGSGGYVAETGSTAVNDAIANMAPGGNGTISGQGGAAADGTNGVLSTVNLTNAAANAGLVGNISNAVTGYSTWRGVDLTQSAVTGMTDPYLIGYTYAGDSLMEGFADTSNYGAIKINQKNGATGVGWSGGDVYYEGFADSSDYGIINANFKNNLPALYPQPSSVGGVVSAPGGGAVAPVPEPGSVSLLIAALACVGLLVRRGVKA